MTRFEEIQADADDAYDAVTKAAEVMAKATAMYNAAVKADFAANAAYNAYLIDKEATRLRMYRSRVSQTADKLADAQAEAAYEEYTFRYED